MSSYTTTITMWVELPVKITVVETAADRGVVNYQCPEYSVPPSSRTVEIDNIEFPYVPTVHTGPATQNQWINEHFPNLYRDIEEKLEKQRG